jgi:hypothetical protein
MARSSLLRLSARLYGPPPTADATRLQRLLYVRRISIRSLLLYVAPVVIIVAISHGTWLLVAIGACMLFSVANLASLSLRIRREEKVGSDGR